MKNLALASVLAVAVLAISGCSHKCGCAAPSYPTCVAKPACGCK